MCTYTKWHIASRASDHGMDLCSFIYVFFPTRAARIRRRDVLYSSFLLPYCSRDLVRATMAPGEDSDDGGGGGRGGGGGGGGVGGGGVGGGGGRGGANNQKRKFVVVSALRALTRQEENAAR